MRKICNNFAKSIKSKAMENTEKIKLAGLKLTPQRTAVYNAMTTLRHAKLDEIVDFLNKEGNMMTLSTIYRILESFCKANLLSLVCRPDTGECYYDITVKEHHHVFEKGSIVDFDDQELTNIVLDYLKKKNPELKDIERVQVQIIKQNKQ